MNTNRQNYQAWNVQLTDFPKNGMIEDKIKFFTRFGILSANIHNTQPWIFQIDKNSLSIFPNKKYQLSAGDPSGNNMYITMGCCITNIEAIASYYRYEITVTPKADKNKHTYAKLEFKLTGQTQELSSLAPFIIKRYSNKREYLPQKIEENKVKLLQKLKVGTTTSLFINEKKTIQNIAILQENAVESIASKDFTRELSYWVTANNTNRSDGMPGFVEGFNQMKAVIGTYLLRYFPKIIVKNLSQKNRTIIEKSPLIGIISTSVINKEIAVDIGRLYQRIALQATSLGINCTPMHAVIEDKKNAETLTKLLQLQHQKPRFLFRLGYSTDSVYHTPRRDIESFYRD